MKLLASIVAIAGTAVGATGMSPPTCVLDSRTIELFMEFEHEYVTNASSCSGLAGVWASAVDLQIVTDLGSGNCRPDRTYPDGMFFDASADNKSSGPIGCQASAFAEGQLGQYGEAGVNWLCTTGESISRSYSIVGTTKCYEDLGGTLEFRGTRDDLGLASAGIEASKIFTYPGSITWLSSISMEVEIVFDGNGSIVPRELRRLYFLSETLRRGSGTPRVRQGVFAAFNDGTTHRLGFMDDSAFDPQPTSNGWSVQLADFELDGALPSGEGDLTLEVVHDVVDHLNGNLDPAEDGDQPIVCYEDRAILYGLLGKSIGDSAYTPRADLNLDGDINQADIAAFNGLPCNANWDCSTTAPVLNSADFTAYLQSFGAADPVADVDGDGSLNVADYTAFLQAYAVGCN